MTDFIFMTQGTSQMYITGPDVIKAVTGEEITHDELGGAMAHATCSGVCHFAIEGEEECLLEIRRLISFLPLNNMDDPPLVETGDDINPRDTRPKVIRTLEMLRNKTDTKPPKKHGNIPF